VQNPRIKRLIILAAISSILYLLNRFLIIPTQSEFSFFSNYFGDLLALPVYLPLSVYLAQRLKLIPDDFQLTLLHILFAGLLFSILFEGIVPAIDSAATRDPWDIVAYFVGGFVVYGIGSVPGIDQTNQDLN